MNLIKTPLGYKRNFSAWVFYQEAYMMQQLTAVMANVLPHMRLKCSKLKAQTILINNKYTDCHSQVVSTPVVCT
jgi:hypothetical protein